MSTKQINTLIKEQENILEDILILKNNIQVLEEQYKNINNILKKICKHDKIIHYRNWDGHRYENSYNCKTCRNDIDYPKNESSIEVVYLD